MNNKNNETVENLRKELSEYQSTVQELQKSNAKMFDILLKEHLSDINSKNKFLFENTLYAKAVKKNKELLKEIKSLPTDLVSKISNKLNNIERKTIELKAGIYIPLCYYAKEEVYDILAEILEEYNQK